MTAMWIVGLLLVVLGWVGFGTMAIPMHDWFDEHRILLIPSLSLLALCFIVGTFLVTWGTAHGG